MGSIAFGVAHHEEKASSKTASRHISTTGNNCAGGRFVVNVTVMFAHFVIIEGVAPFCGPWTLAENFPFRYPRNSVDSVCLIPAEFGMEAPSMKDTNLLTTASRLGTWVNKIGFVEIFSSAEIAILE